jgi:hypothetical protein
LITAFSKLNFDSHYVIKIIILLESPLNQNTGIAVQNTAIADGGSIAIAIPLGAAILLQFQLIAMNCNAINCNELQCN